MDANNNRGVVVKRATLLAFAVLWAILGLSGCGGGGAEESVPGSTAAGAAAPSTPTGLAAAAMSFSQINLSWNVAPENAVGAAPVNGGAVTGYNVYRGETQIAALGTVTTFQDAGLTPSTDYSYSVEAVSASGEKSGRTPPAWGRTKSPPDTTAPSTPTGLGAAAASSSQINLSWTAATDNVGIAGYNVYRGGVLIAALGTVTTFQNTSLAVFTTYSYTVQAYDAAGNVSGHSSSASAATQAVPDTTAPSTPTGLSATATSSSQINLSWTAATDNVGVTGYNVYRGGALIASLGAVTSFQNTGLAASTPYSYTVRALDAAGNLSAPSASAITSTPAAPDTTTPSIPLGLTAAAVSSVQINLSWAASTDNVGVTGYNIYRGGIQIATVGAVTTFQNTGLTASTTYSYTVRARDAAGNVSGQSIAASATTQAPDTTAALVWDPVTVANLAGYRVYFGTAPGSYLQPLGQGVNVGNSTTHTVTGLNRGTRYYFAVTAFDASNGESAYSTEIFKDIP
jgi:chitodextrinase